MPSIKSNLYEIMPVFVLTLWQMQAFLRKESPAAGAGECPAGGDDLPLFFGMAASPGRKGGRGGCRPCPRLWQPSRPLSTGKAALPGPHVPQKDHWPPWVQRGPKNEIFINFLTN